MLVNVKNGMRKAIQNYGFIAAAKSKYTARRWCKNRVENYYATVFSFIRLAIVDESVDNEENIFSSNFVSLKTKYSYLLDCS